MNKVNIHNYEAYILDYLEGNINAEDTADLLLFIEQNPELEIELDENNMPYFNDDETVSFSGKHELYKSNAELQFEELCLAYFEGDISEEGENQLIELRESKPEFDKQFKAFSKVYLSDEDLIEFPFKDGLKKVFLVESSFESLAVKQVEGTLTDKEAQVLTEKVAQDQQLAYDLCLFEKTKLPCEKIEFEGKRELYKKEIGFFMPNLFTYVAAALILIFTLGFLLTNEKLNDQGLALKRIESPTQIRGAQSNKFVSKHIKEDAQSNKSVSESGREKDENKLIQSPAKLGNVITEPIQVNSDYQNIKRIEPLAAKEVRTFQLPAEYIALSPNDLQELLNTNNSSSLSQAEQYLKPGQFLKKKVAKILKKQNIDIDTPIRDIQKNGLSQIGINGIKKVTKGKVRVDVSDEESNRKVTSIHFFGLTYKRSTN